MSCPRLGLRLYSVVIMPEDDGAWRHVALPTRHWLFFGTNSAPCLALQNLLRGGCDDDVHFCGGSMD